MINKNLKVKWKHQNNKWLKNCGGLPVLPGPTGILPWCFFKQPQKIDNNLKKIVIIFTRIIIILANSVLNGDYVAWFSDFWAIFKVTPFNIAA